MNKPIRIGIDLMGADRSPRELFQAVISASKEFGSKVSFVVFATDSESFSPSKSLPITSRISFAPVQQVISMEEEPVKAVRSKKNSSIVLGIKALRRKKIDAFISGGNTGALIAAASLFLPKAQGIKRPALLASLPSEKGNITVIDVGANIQCKASLLYQYALLGASHHSAFWKIDIPKIGLLNVGTESIKGSLEHQEAFRLLSSLPGFVGNVEGRDIFNGDIDVLVTDGFTGNVLLKSSEGIASFIFETLKKKAPVELREELDLISRKFNWSLYPGARVVGVEGIVIKCHGSSDERAFLSGVRGAVQLLQVKLKR